MVMACGPQDSGSEVKSGSTGGNILFVIDKVLKVNGLNSFANAFFSVDITSLWQENPGAQVSLFESTIIEISENVGKVIDRQQLRDLNLKLKAHFDYMKSLTWDKEANILDANQSLLLLSSFENDVLQTVRLFEGQPFPGFKGKTLGRALLVRIQSYKFKMATQLGRTIKGRNNEYLDSMIETMENDKAELSAHAESRMYEHMYWKTLEAKKLGTNKRKERYTLGLCFKAGNGEIDECSNIRLVCTARYASKAVEICGGKTREESQEAKAAFQRIIIPWYYQQVFGEYESIKLSIQAAREVLDGEAEPELESELPVDRITETSEQGGQAL